MPFNATSINTAPQGTFVSGVFTDTFDVGFNEVNMVALDLVEGLTYDIDVDNAAGVDFYLRVFDQFGSEVRANDDGNRTNDDIIISISPFLQFTPNYSGRYYVALSPWYLDSYDPISTIGRNSGENPMPTRVGTLRVEENGTLFWGSAASINGIVAESLADFTDTMIDTDGSNRVEVAGSLDGLTDVDITRIDLNKGDTLVVDVNGALTGSTVGTFMRVFTDVGTQIGVDDLQGFDDDPELVFFAPNTNDYYIGISSDGNETYNALDGTGAVIGAFSGNFEVIIHRNPTQIGSSLANFFNGDEGANYIVSLAGNDTVNGNDGHDTLAGGDEQDILSGGNNRDVIYGEHGNDTLNGGNGSDVLSGGLGNDSLDGGKGVDLLSGGAGNDTLLSGLGNSDSTMRGDAGDDVLTGGKGIDLLFGGSENDLLSGAAGNDSLNGDQGSDTLNGQAGNDLLSGGSGNDLLFGGSENDSLSGGDNDDQLSGDFGDDRLSGGLGLDSLNGGAGFDVFVFENLTSGLDLVQDMVLGTDRIDLSSIFAATGSVVTLANLAQFIQVTPAGAGADSFLAVDANGATGGLSFTTIAQVVGVTNVQLFAIDNFLV